jgi:hypothetical protein
MRFKLTYQIGLATVQEWIFTSKSLAYWKKMDLLETGRYNDGRFKVTPFRRHYLCWALYRSQELTLGEVGKLFNRDHSTVLHSIRKHEELKTDRLYKKMTESCAQLMAEPLTFTRQRRNIFEDINKATNLEKLRRIRRWNHEGRYDHQKSFQQQKQYVE